MKTKFQKALGLMFLASLIQMGTISYAQESITVPEEVQATLVTQEETLDQLEYSKQLEEKKIELLNSLTPEQLSGVQPIVGEDGSLSYFINGKLQPVKVGKGNGRLIDKQLTSIEQSQKMEGKTELIEKRDEYTTHFDNGDGTITAVISGIPVYYKNGNRYEVIDIAVKNTEGEFAFSNETNTFKSYFSGLNKNKKAPVARFTLTNNIGDTHNIDYFIKKYNPSEVKLQDNSVFYTQIEKNVNLEFIIDSTKLKENLYLNEPVKQFTYEFYLKMDGLLLESDGQGGFYFIDEKTKEQLWRIVAPLAEDSGLVKLSTREMHYEVSDEVSNGELMKKFTLVFDDKSFLKKAVYPVIIDPTMARINGRSVLSTGSFAQDDSVYGYAFPGYPSGLTNGEYILYLNFNISSIPSNASVTNSVLTIVPQGTLGSSGPGPFVVSRLLSSFNNCSWSSRPAISTSNQATHNSYGTSTKTWNLTEMMKEIINNKYTFYGVELRATPAHAHSFYYDYTNYPSLTVDYVLNSAPIVSLSTPLDNSLYSETSTSVIPQINVSDADNNNLTCKVFIDSESTPRSTVNLSSTTTAKPAIFSAINMSALSSGSHTIRFEVNDGMTTTTKTVNFKVDKEAPVISTNTITESTNSININVVATDSVSGLDTAAYQFGLNGSLDSWVSGSSKLYSALQPNQSYTVAVNVKDKVGHVVSTNTTKVTLAAVPTLNITASTASSLTLGITDLNPNTTSYQIMIGSLYLGSDGKTTATPQWITIPSKSIIATGLQALTEYEVKIKARNINSIETAFSAVVKGITSSNAPAAPTNLTVLGTGNRTVISWNAAATATQYELDINGTVINNADALTYIHSKLVPGQVYQYKVRALNAFGPGSWSIVSSYTVPKNIVAISAQTGSEYLVSFTVSHVQSFTGKIYKVAYDQTALAVQDLCEFTNLDENGIGVVTGQNIEILSIGGGVITFKMTTAIDSGYDFSGTINTIRFKAIKDATTQVTFSIQ